MEREKLYKALLEDEGFKGSSLSILNNHIYSAHPNVIVNFISRDPVDFRLGSEISECFEEDEELSDHGSEVKYFAKVTSDEYIIPNARQVKYFSSKFKLMDGFQGLYSVEHVDLYGSELTTIFPPSISLIALKNNSKVNLNLIKKSKFGRVFLHNITVQGNNCEILMEAKVKDNTITEDFRIIVEGSDNKIDVDLRKLAIGHFKLFFNSSGSNNYVNIKVGKKTDVLVNFWSNETEGVKVIIEGGRNVNVDDLVNNNVEYEIR